MTRIDLYGMVHKGLRAELLEVAADVALANWRAAAEAEELSARVRRLVGYLAEHAEHEDAQVMPLVAQADARVARDLAQEHEAVETSLGELLARLDDLDRAPEMEREPIGQALRELLARMLTQQFLHMQREETQANAALWSRFTDEELNGVHERILSSIAPPRMAEWFELLLPAMGELERVGFVAELNSKLPNEAFDALLSRARVRLGETEWRRICARAAIAPERLRFEARQALGATR